MISSVTSLTDDLKLKIFDLWNSNYPIDIALKTEEDFSLYLAGLDNKTHFMIINSHDMLEAWMMTFSRDNKTQLAMIVDFNAQNKGLGSMLLEKAKELNTSLYGWIVQSNEYKLVNGKSYKSPAAFYIKNGFEIQNDISLENAPIKAERIYWGNK